MNMRKSIGDTNGVFIKKNIVLALLVCAAAHPLMASGQASGSKAAAEGALKPFRLGHLNSTAHLLAFVAKEEGFFAEEGLDAELTQFASASELVAGVESGKLDMAFIAAVNLATFQATGHELSVIGGAMTNGHGYVIKGELVPPGYKTGDISILKGKNVATVKNSVQEYELLVLLKNNRLTLGKDVNIVYFSSHTEAYNAIQNKEIDVVSVYSPYTSRARNEGHAVVYYCNEKPEFLNQPCCRQVVYTPTLKEKSGLFHAAARAFIKAYKFSQENHEKTVTDVNKYIPLASEMIDYEVYGGHSVSNPDPDKKATVKLRDELAAFGYTNYYDIEPLFNTAIYQAALEELVKANPDDAVYRNMQVHFNRFE
ncbi:MAG: ABC transporter substrate-binding protein [Spirochaetaceae bacterium]|jgi:NitT/TauT family transport system substrate-binding protein|nr:ABC transporter substrate-binding protein [Spirochaetaceae bacterium]